MSELDSNFSSRKVMPQRSRVLEAVRSLSSEGFQYLTWQGSEQPSLALETAVLGLQLDTFRGPFQIRFFIASLMVRTALLQLHDCEVPDARGLSPSVDSRAAGTTVLSGLETMCNVRC